MSKLDVIRMQRDNAEAWRYMPQVLDRLYRFCGEMDTESSAPEVVDLVRAWFAVGDIRLGLWVGVMDNVCIAHTFATPEPVGMDHWKYVLIRQAKVDPGIDMRDETKQTMLEVIEWTKSLGLKQVNIVTHRDEAAMLRRWSFKNYKLLMRLDL